MITRYRDLILNSGTAIPNPIHVSQYDEGEQWIFNLYTEEGILYKPTTGSIVGVKSDSNIVFNDAVVNADGQVVVTESAQMTASAGTAIFELSIDGNTHGTANFAVYVEPRPGDNGTVSGSDLSALQTAIEVVKSLGDIEDIFDALAIAQNMADKAGKRAGESEASAKASAKSATEADASADKAGIYAGQALEYRDTTKAYRDEVIAASSAVIPTITLFVDSDDYISVNYNV